MASKADLAWSYGEYASLRAELMQTERAIGHEVRVLHTAGISVAQALKAPLGPLRRYMARCAEIEKKLAAYGYKVEAPALPNSGESSKR